MKAKSIVEISLNRVEKWVEGKNYLAYEPFDGLSSVFRALCFGSIFLDRLLMQAVRISPINIRPLLGIHPLPSTKGRGYMAWGYLTRYKTTNDAIFKKKAFDQLDWLDKHKSPKFQDHSWANHFDFSSRGGRYYKHDSIIVWTSLIGQAYLEAFELFREPRHLEIIQSIKRWIMALPREKTSQGDCLSYLMYAQSSIHNSNMLGAAFLARAAKHTNDNEALEVARSAMLYSCARQREDGAWWYGEHPKYHWVDNFHTGYNLDSLKCYIDYTGDKTWANNLSNGLAYYKRHFFEETGKPKYYDYKTYPVDSQCAGQALETLSHFGNYDPESLTLASKVALWWIDNMQDKDGFFYFRQYPWGVKSKIPMLHWSQAVIYKGLSVLLSKL